MVLIIRANFDYSAEDDTELNFKERDILEVLESSRNDEWWMAKINGGDGKYGFVPSNFFEILADTSLTSSDEDSILAVDVKRSCGAFQVTVAKKNGPAVVSKPFASFLSFSSELAKASIVLPYSLPLSDGPGTDQQIEEYLKGVISSGLDNLLNAFLFPGQRSTISVDFRTRSPSDSTRGRSSSGGSARSRSGSRGVRFSGKGGRVLETVIAIAEWEPAEDNELRMSCGERVEVIAKPSEDWWEGKKENGTVGLFPVNYVEPASVGSEKTPKGRRGTSRSQQAAQLALTVDVPPEASVSPPVVSGTVVTPSEKERTVAFSLASLDAFDDLIKDGFAVEMTGGDPSGCQRPKEGDRVTLEVTALTWDGTNSYAVAYSSTLWGGGDLCFIVGSKQVLSGLDTGVRCVPVGVSANIIASPVLAFGDDGLPPHVPPGAHVVFQLRVLHLEPAPYPAQVSSGPPLLMQTGTESCFAEPQVSMEGFGGLHGDVSTDELIEQARMMGIGGAGTGGGSGGVGNGADGRPPMSKPATVSTRLRKPPTCDPLQAHQHYCAPYTIAEPSRYSDKCMSIAFPEADCASPAGVKNRKGSGVMGMEGFKRDVGAVRLPVAGLGTSGLNAGSYLRGPKAPPGPPPVKTGGTASPFPCGSPPLHGPPGPPPTRRTGSPVRPPSRGPVRPPADAPRTSARAAGISISSCSVVCTLAQLQAGTPEGVDDANKERYLSDEEFMEVFKMTKSVFAGQPAWKRAQQKKSAKIF